MKFIDCWRREGVKGRAHYLCKQKFRFLHIPKLALNLEPLAELVDKDMEILFNHGIANAYIDFTK